MAELLVAKHDGQVAVRVPLDDRRKLTLGRSHRCDLRLDSSSISRRHALLFEYDSQWHLVDTGSRTGIHCELEQVPHVVLHDDRWARIGPAYLWLRDGDDVAPAAPVRPPIRPNASAAFPYGITGNPNCFNSRDVVSSTKGSSSS